MSTVEIVFAIMYFLFVAYSLWSNNDWYKKCCKSNDEWFELCQNINRSWCTSIIQLESRIDELENRIKKMENES